MDGSELNERKKLILRAIVDAHIDRGEPVGSKYLTESKQIGLSSATIRNEMAELEELGYLEQPHTSAGRIPSERGYRFYVDSLMQAYSLTASEINEINKLLKSKVAELDKILENASRLMAGLTNYPALAMNPRSDHMVVQRFKVVLLESDMLLLVMITGLGAVKSKYIRSELPLNDSVAETLEDALNRIIAGLPADMITLPRIYDLERRLGDYSSLVGPVIKNIYEVINDSEVSDIRIDGVDKLLSYPEYADTEKLRDMLGLIEKKEDIIEIISNSKNSGVNVYIGSENAAPVLRDSTLIFKNVMSDGKALGVIGVIGPRRMDYSRVISTVEKLAENIAEASKLYELGGDNKIGGNNE